MDALANPDVSPVQSRGLRAGHLQSRTHVARRNAQRAVDGADACRLLDPTEGIDQAIHALAELVRVHQCADVCVIVTNEGLVGQSRVYHADDRGTTPLRAKRIDRDLKRLLLTLSDGTVVFNRHDSRSCNVTGENAGRFGSRKVYAEHLAELADLLETDSFLSLPLRGKHQDLGRVHLGWRRASYSDRHLSSVAAMVKQAGIMLESMLPVGRQAIGLASNERKRISRDLHDGTVQPYVGLKLGLEALRRRIRDVELAREVDELITMAGEGIDELRQYVGKLRRGAGAPKELADGLLPALRRQAKKFTEFYGIETRVLAEKDIPVTPAMHDEIVHMVREGLSNIRRHTSAGEATIRLGEGEGRLLIELVNDNAKRNGAKQEFFPRSIGERAKELGGRLRVQHAEGGYTVVAVELPI
jgi:signal transduction histidine kinase